MDATVWTLQNGIKVILKNTDFKDDQILMTGTSEGDIRDMRFRTLLTAG